MENIKLKLKDKVSFLKYLEKFNLSKEEIYEIDNKMSHDAIEYAYEITNSHLKDSFIEGYENGYHQALDDTIKHIKVGGQITVSAIEKYEEVKTSWEENN